MKTLSLYFALLTCILAQPVKLVAQNYIPFPDSNAIWTDYSNDDIPLYYSNGLLNKDTLLSNGKVYHQIFSSMDCGFNDFQLAGFLRQDTLLRRVYYTNPYILRDSPGSEFIAYDFKLKVGDSLFKDNGYYVDGESTDTFSFPVIVKSIDSIKIGGVYRKQICMNWPYSCFVEGIGNIERGLLSKTDRLSTNGPYPFACFKKDGKWVYPENGNCEICYGIKAGIRESTGAEPDLTAYPNPSSDKLFIQLLQPNYFTSLKIYTTEGKLVFERPIKNPDQQIELTKDDLGGGLYFYQLRSPALTKTGKFILY